LIILIGLASPVQAATPPVIASTATALQFPQSITFTATIRAPSNVTEITLEYGVNQRTCGLVTALAFPTFTPAREAMVSWTWDMRRSGSLPPGATLWYRWRAKDADGGEVLGEQQQVTWLDNTHPWKTITNGRLNLHWYLGDLAFARDLLDSAAASLKRLGETTGVVPDRDVQLYIYANSAEMREAVLYEPGWTGGLAYPEHNLTIIGIAPEDIAWGKRTAAHELTHVLVGNRAFSCVGSIPTWLNEGIAVYGEGGPEAAALEQFTTARKTDALLSVRSLSGGFSEDPQQADLSYSQSYSIVRFLIDEYGQQKLLQVFDQLGSGDAIEPVLRKIYGFGLDGLEDHWRASITAKPRQNAGVEPTATALPSPIPTIQLAAQPALIATSPPNAAATSAPSPMPTPSTAQPTAQPATETTQTNGWGAAPIIGILLGIGIMFGVVFLRNRKRGR
jgi:hypothetical protein